MIRIDLRFTGVVLLLGIVLWGTPVQRAHADTNVSCTATMTNLSYGSISFTDGSGSGNGAAPTATLNYTCTNNAALFQEEAVNVCFNIGDGVQGGGNFNPRRMTDTAGDALQFQLFQSTTTSNWGSNSNTPAPYSTTFVIPGSLLGGTTHSGTYTMRGTLISNQTTAPPGSYQDQFSGDHTQIQVNSVAGATAPASCIGGTSGNLFPFTVTAIIVKGCTVTANNVNFGAVPFNTSNLSANATLSVLCSFSTPYFVGLSPSNGNTAGAGIMKGTIVGNTDQIAYQLRSTTGLTGTIWGNTATSTSAGNGVGGNGTGLTQSLTVYATIPTTKVTPDAYADTVTVYVNY